MVQVSVEQAGKRPRRLVWWIEITFLLLLVFGCLYIVNLMGCLDGCGPYHHSSSVADFDGDGDLDVALFNRRHESDTTIWAGPTLWINQRSGRFTRSDQELSGGFSGSAGDVDGDGSADILVLAFNKLMMDLNRGGVPEWDQGIFRIRDSVNPDEDLGMTGSVVLGDLDNDGDLDGFVAGCCGKYDPRRQPGETRYPPAYSWVWINERNQWGRLENRSVDLRELGDLSIRAAALGDLDGDGDLDAFAALQPPQGGSPDESADRVLLNDGTGNFRDSGQRLSAAGPVRNIAGSLLADLRRLLPPAVRDATGEPGAEAVALGDLDGDGDLDALVGTATGSQAWINQAGAQGGSPGSFASSGQQLPGDAGEAVTLADLDGDGDLDALLVGIRQAAAWLNEGQGVFRDSGQRLDYSVRHGLALGDFDGDGDLDVFAAASDEEQTLWLNEGGRFVR